MAQLMQIQLQRFDAQPWGFRLQGGTDFAAPLVVQKINSGSLAEQAGLLPGDAVIKINDVDVYNLRHKDAQDLVVRSGNNFIVTVQRGGMTWRPSVTPTGQLPSPNPHSPYGQTVTKTSLAHKQQEVHHIGSGYNNSARPFNSVNGNDGQVKSIVNKQYNTPVGIYSDETIAETLSAQAEVLAGGVLGINFKKNEKQYSGDKSEVLKFLQEEETGEHEPVQHHNPPQIINNHIPSQNQNQSNVTRHVKAPVDRPKPPSTGGLPTGQNICTECERLIVGVFVRIKDKNLHVECFKCATCGTSLKNQGYYNFNNKLYCDIHARLAASQNPPSGTEGYVPVPIKPNTKLSASTISAALNNIGYNGSPTNGTSTPLYSAPPSNVNQGFARPYGAPAPAPAAAPKSPTSYPPPQVANQAGSNNNNNWNQPRQIPVQHQQHQQQPASNMYATLPRSNAGPQEPNTNNTPKQTFPINSSTLPRMKPTIVKPPVGGSPAVTAGSSQTSDATSMLSDSIGKITINNKNNFMAEAGKIISNMLESRLANNSKNNSTNDLTTLSGSTGNINTLTRSPMVVRKRFELEDFKNVDPTAPADLKPTQVVMPLEQLKVQQQPLKQNSVNIGLTGTGDGGLIQPNHHMKNLLDICDAKNLQNSGKNMMVPNQEVKVGLVTVPIPPPQLLPVVQQKAQPQTPAAPPQPPAPTQTSSNELIPLETVIFRNKNKRPNKGGELSTQANDRRSYIERDEPSFDNNPPVFEISVKPTRGNAADDDQGMDETKAVVSQLLKDGKRPICCQCDKEISRGPFITALGRIWCPDHFMCVNANCRRPLQDVGFVEEKGDLYCEYCFEKYLAPTCSKCSGKIKGDCLNAIGRHFHPECFTCAHCGKLFGNTPFFLEEGMAYCEADWNELFTTKCFACGFPVEAGDRWVEALGNNYHSQCFNCTYCKKNLEGQSFYNKGGRPFCKNHAR